VIGTYWAIERFALVYKIECSQMDLEERYREHAANCVRLAQQSANAADKALLLEMAKNWIDLAERVKKKGGSDLAEPR
jgi:hypothetical protein